MYLHVGIRDRGSVVCLFPLGEFGTPDPRISLGPIYIHVYFLYSIPLHLNVSLEMYWTGMQ